MASANPKLRDWKGRRVWLLGASTGIGAALAEALAARGAQLTLTARNVAALEGIAARCGAGTRVLAADLTDPASLDGLFAAFDAGREPLPELGIYLAGDYTPLDAVDGEAVRPALHRMLAVNYVAAADWSLAFAQRLAAQNVPSDENRSAGAGHGIALVASVAGYSGLPKALAYAPSKAALIRFAECLHLDLAASGIGVWLINPGFVATRLTAQNDFSMPALITAGQAAEEIIAGLGAGRFEVHFPKRFTRLMKLLAILPYAILLPLLRRVHGGRQ